MARDSRKNMFSGPGLEVNVAVLTQCTQDPWVSPQHFQKGFKNL